MACTTGGGGADSSPQPFLLSSHQNTTELWLEHGFPEELGAKGSVGPLSMQGHSEPVAAETRQVPLAPLISEEVTFPGVSGHAQEAGNAFT